MFKKKSTDAATEESTEGKKKKKNKKPKPSAVEKATKNKQKVEKAANAKVKKAEAAIKKAEAAEKKKEQAAEKKANAKVKKEEKLVKAEEKKLAKKEKAKEKKAAKKARKKEMMAERKAAKAQRKAELAARTPLQKKIDRRLKIRKFIVSVLLVLMLAGTAYAANRFGPVVLEKYGIEIPEIHVMETWKMVKEHIPFLKDPEPPEEEDDHAEELQPPEPDPDADVEEEVEPPTLNIAGNAALEEYYTEALTKYMRFQPEEVAEHITVTSNANAYAMLINGEVDVIFASFPSDIDTRNAQLAGVDLQPIPVMNSGLVFFVHKDNPVKNLTKTQLYNIYTGTITNWKELGGRNQTIIPYQRTNGSGAQNGMYRMVVSENEIMPAGADMKPETTKDILKAVNSDPGAIGYSYFYYLEKEDLKKTVKTLTINSVKATKGSIEKARYPLTSYSYAVITTEEKTKSLEDIIGEVDSRLEKARAQADAAKAAALAEEGAKDGEEAKGGEEVKEPTDQPEDTPDKEEMPLKMKFIKWLLTDTGQKLVEKHGFLKHRNDIK